MTAAAGILRPMKTSFRSRASPLRGLSLERRTLGPYSVLGQIGESPLGVWFRVQAGDQRARLHLLASVAPVEDLRLRTRVQDRLKAAQALRHPNLVPVLDSGDHEGAPYVVAADVSGHPLTTYLGRPHRWRDTLRIAEGVAEALDFAHARGFVHGGLEPDHVWVDANGAAIVDNIGVAPLIWLLPAAKRAAVFQEHVWIAPEQLDGEPATTRSDVFAFAAMVYELVTGRRAYPVVGDYSRQPPRPSSLVDGLNPNVDVALLSALSPNPQDRPSAAGIVLRDLAGATSGSGRGAKPLLLYVRHHADPPSTAPTAPAIDSPPLHEPLGAKVGGRLPTRRRAIVIRQAVNATMGRLPMLSRWRRYVRQRPFEACLGALLGL
ncbi:MAG: protein kinase, partial [Dehalococcoidia bacterium]|nr:protein kinase [Dehalococcoidia bacterium]